jgi:hypothetical protein
VSFPESLQSPDAPSGRDDLDVRDVSDDFEHPLSTVARVSVGANWHFNCRPLAVHVASLREWSTVVNDGLTNRKWAALTVAGVLLSPWSACFTQAGVNGVSDVLWLEEHGEEQRGRILPPAIQPS